MAPRVTVFGRRSYQRLGRRCRGAVFGVSLVARMLDQAPCPSWSSGTHGIWHGLTARVLYCMYHPWLTTND
jgi:hypothetical protein